MESGGDMRQNPKMLRGVFSAILYNKKNHSLIVLRDAMGVRPLFMIHTRVAWMIVSDIRVVYRWNEWLNDPLNQITDDDKKLCEIEDILEFTPGTI